MIPEKKVVLYWRVLTLLLICSSIPLILTQSYDCTTAGRFRYSDSTCRSYYICAYYNGAWLKSNYTCPSAKVFDATSQICSSSATCIDSLCDDLPTVPLFPTVSDPNAVNCSSYIVCYGNSTKYPVVTYCPSGYYYNNAINDTGCWFTGSC